MNVGAFDIVPEVSGASLVAQLVKNLPAVQETWVQSLGWEDLLKKGKATHASILAWRIPWTAYSMGLQSWSNFHFQQWIITSLVPSVIQASASRSQAQKDLC